VSNIESDGAPRVTKDGYDKGYIWDQCRSIATLEAQSGASSAVATVRANEDEKEDEGAVITWHIGQRVEVKDDGTEWEIGTVIAVDEDDKKARVRKDGYDSGYFWDHCRVLASDTKDEDERSQASSSAAAASSPESEGASKKKGWFSWARKSSNRDKSTSSTPDLENQATSQAAVAQSEEEKKSQLSVQEEEEEDKHEVEEDVDDEDDKDGEDEDEEEDGYEVEENATSSKNDDEEESEEVEEVESAKEEVAQDILRRMRLYAREHGGMRATELFETFDKDNSGKIEIRELRAAMLLMGIEDATIQDAKEIMSIIDKDGDGKLDYHELLKALKDNIAKEQEEEEEESEVETSKEAAAQDILRRMRLYAREHGGMRATELFETFDKDKNGTIEIREFRAAMILMGIENVTLQDAKDIMAIIDCDGDGKLDYNELLKALKDNIARDQKEEEQTGDEDEDQEEEDDEEEEEDDEEDDDDDEEEEGEEDDDDDEEEDVDEEEEENEDGDEETAEKDSATAVSSAYEPSDSDSVKPQAAPERLSVGARVEGLFDEGDEWFPGKITKVWPDGRYDLLYDDGDEEVKVPGALVRLDARPFSEKYTLENVLGEGSFSVVRKAKRNSDGAVFAVKCIQRSQLSALETANLQREIDIMRDMHHPHVVGLVDVFENEKDTIYLVQDFVEGGELFDRIQAKTVYNEAEARVVVELMLSTLAHLHSRHVVHRDLKVMHRLG
jgi:Ca2+-binding EF-hand superfamily protein